MLVQELEKSQVSDFMRTTVSIVPARFAKTTLYYFDTNSTFLQFWICHFAFPSPPLQLDLLEANNQLKHAHQQLNASQQNNVAKGGIDEAQRKEIEAQLVQMEEFKKQLDNQAKAIESERKLFEEQRYAQNEPHSFWIRRRRQMNEFRN